MTHSNGQAHVNVGDRGQRYEVRCTDSKGKRMTFGWAGNIKGAQQMVDAINLSPTWTLPEIIDRQKGTPA